MPTRPLSKSSIDDRVVVVWNLGDVDGRVGTLREGRERSIRTYRPDAVDPRALRDDIPTATDGENALALLAAGEGSRHSILLPVRLARQLFGWRLSEFGRD